MKFRVNGQNRLQIGYNGNVDVLYDDANLQIGAGQELRLVHNGTDSYINNTTGIFWIQNQVTSSAIYMRSDELLLQSYTDNPNENYIVCTRGAAVKLYHNNLEKLSTRSDGVLLTSSGSWHGLRLNHSNGNEVFYLANKGSGDEGYLALKNDSYLTIYSFKGCLSYNRCLCFSMTSCW